jgi:hypothetical protein
MVGWNADRVHTQRLGLLQPREHLSPPNAVLAQNLIYLARIPSIRDAFFAGMFVMESSMSSVRRV